MARPAGTIARRVSGVDDDRDEYVVRRLLWVVFVLVVTTSITYVGPFVMLCEDPAVTFAGKTPPDRGGLQAVCCSRNARLVVAGMRSPTAMQPNGPDEEG